MKVECKKCPLIKAYQNEVKRQDLIIKKLREPKQIKITFGSN